MFQLSMEFVHLRNHNLSSRTCSQIETKANKTYRSKFSEEVKFPTWVASIVSGKT